MADKSSVEGEISPSHSALPPLALPYLEAAFGVDDPLERFEAASLPEAPPPEEWTNFMWSDSWSGDRKGIPQWGQGKPPDSGKKWLSEGRLAPKVGVLLSSRKEVGVYKGVEVAGAEEAGKE